MEERVVILSARPTEVQETLDVALPRPRDQVTTKELPEFAQLRGHVYRAIKRPSPDAGAAVSAAR